MQRAKWREQTLLCNMLAKFLETSTEHTDPLSYTTIWRPAHLHWWVFMVRSCSRGQFDSSDPKAPDVCLEIISSDLKNIRGCYCVPLTVLHYHPFHTPFPQNLERPALQRRKEHFPPPLAPAPCTFKEVFQKSQSDENHRLCTVQPGLLCHKLCCRT